MSNCGSENSIGHFTYISDRTRRITEALYRVTDLFSDEEPMKWLLRNDAVKIFSRLSALQDNSLAARVKDIEHASQVIGRMSHALELASSGTLLSHINFEVLKREYGALKEFIGANTDALLPQPQVDLKDALPAPQITSPYLPVRQVGQPLPIVERGVANEEPVKVLSKNVREPAPKQEAFSEEIKITDNAAVEADSGRVSKVIALAGSVAVRDIKKEADIGLSERDNEARLVRQKKILEFVKNNGWVGVGDVSVVFAKAISEKTIQRELMAMADAGILRKAGDKRWRRYACI